MIGQLALLVLRQARDDAALDGDRLLVLANDPGVSYWRRQDHKRDLRAHLDALSFLHGSKSFRLWCLAAGLRPTQAVRAWMQYAGDPCLL